MKRLFTLLAIALVATTTLLAASRTISASDLPRKAQLFIERYYGSPNIHHIKVDSRFLGGVSEYEVTINNGTEIDFDRDGEVKEIYCAGISTVPNEVLPFEIRDFLNKNYPGQQVVKLEVKKKKYEVKLRSGIELLFSRDGRFLGIDD